MKTKRIAEFVYYQFKIYEQKIWFPPLVIIMIIITQWQNLGTF